MKHPLPRGWHEVRLGDICDINVNSLKENTNENYQFKYIDLSSVKNGIIDFPNNYITFKNAPSRARRIIKIDDVIMATVRPNLKGFAYISFDPKEYICSTGFAVLTSKSKICMKYIYQILYANYIEKQISNMLVGSNYPALNTSDILNIKILLPPLDEQNRIAEVLSLCDKLIENLTKLIEKKEIYKKGVMQRVLSGEVRFDGFTDEWKEYKLEDIGISYNGLTNKNASNFKNNCNAKYITYKSICDCNKIDIKRLEDVYIEENEKQNLVQYGDAFFTISSVTPEVAISSVLLDEVENTYLNSFCFGFRFDFNILIPEFARYYFRSNYVRKYTYKLSQGTTRFNLSKNKFLEMIVKLPSIEEQKKIAELLSLIDQDIDNLKQLLHLRKLQKKGLMQKLLTGEVRI